MKLSINNETYEYENGTTLEEVSKELGIKAYCARVNNRLRELSYVMDKDAKVEFLDMSDSDSAIIYQATLRYVIAMAISRLYKDTNIRFSNSISMSIFANLDNKKVDRQVLSEIEKETRRIIAEDYPITRAKYSIDEMKEYYTSMNYMDKVETLKYRKETVNVYECNGYRNYMYSYMCPSTGYVWDFKFVLYHPGFMIQFPRIESKGYIPEFVDEPNFLKTLRDAKKWADITRSNNIYELNEKCDNEEELLKYINVCESRFNHQLFELGERIEKGIDDIRLIAIAGPSSSGKTTFSKRLEIELLSRNIKPLRISLDNYYLKAEQCPKNSDGTPDFEHVDSLNIDLFNENMTDFLDGKEVRLPLYDFKTHVTSFDVPRKLGKGDVIIIEGIHALNEKLTRSIPTENIFKIYIVPMIQRNIDNHNPISLTELRLIRRIVRDFQFRGTSAEETLMNWKKVRDGERKWIYPFMESADYIFNSSLGFELMSLKEQASSALKAVSKDSAYYTTSNRLLKSLKIYRSIDNSLVQNNSIVREFIGGSVFKE